jgi:hypothetical protein
MFTLREIAVPGDGHDRAGALGALAGQTKLGEAADFDIGKSIRWRHDVRRAQQIDPPLLGRKLRFRCDLVEEAEKTMASLTIKQAQAQNDVDRHWRPQESWQRPRCKGCARRSPRRRRAAALAKAKIFLKNISCPGKAKNLLLT